MSQVSYHNHKLHDELSFITILICHYFIFHLKVQVHIFSCAVIYLAYIDMSILSKPFWAKWTSWKVASVFYTNQCQKYLTHWVKLSSGLLEMWSYNTVNLWREWLWLYHFIVFFIVLHECRCNWLPVQCCWGIFMNLQEYHEMNSSQVYSNWV